MYWPELAACAVAVAWFFHLGYGPTLRPTNIAWLMRGDWASYFWGFSFYRNAEWLWPLGNTPNLFFPIGTSVAFTDANPWASVLFKALSPWLPERFQFFGLWYLLCFVLYALLGARIAAVLTDDKLRRALGGALFAVTPLLPSRNAHIALCAFFFLAAGVLLNLAPARTRADALRLMAWACGWLAWAAGTHGYLVTMLLTLTLAACVRLAAVERVLKPSGALLAAALQLAVVLGVFWTFGYLGWRPMKLTATGFGEFSSDLTSLANPMGWSRWLRGIDVRPRQAEGFCYLGLGVLLVLAVFVLRSARAPAQVLHGLRRQWPLATAVLAMWLYSLSSVITFAGETVLDLRELYAPLQTLTGMFRGSGRFSWPLHVTLVALAIATAARLRDPRAGRALLLVAVLLQAGELKASRLDFHKVPIRAPKHPAWAASERSYRHLALAPLHLQWICRYDEPLVNRLAYEAYRRGWTFNSGNLMRRPPKMPSLCNAPIVPDADTIYVAAPAQRRTLAKSGFTCGRVDDLDVCVSSARPTPLLAALRDPKARAGRPRPSPGNP